MIKRSYPAGKASKFSIINLISFRKNIINYLQKTRDKYGEVAYFKLGPQDMILVCSPDMIKDILVTNQNTFIKGRALEHAKVLLGEGLLTSEKELHKKQRRMIQPAFNHSRINNYGLVMADFAQERIKTWENNKRLDISKEMMELTLDIVCKSLFDIQVKEDAEKIRAALAISLEMFMEFTNPIFHLLKNVPSPKKIKFEKALKFFDEIILKIINEKKNSNTEKDDLLSALLNAQDEEDNKKGMDNKQIRDEILTLFLAGHETTSHWLTWTLYLISQNLKVEAEIQKEIESLIGTRSITPEDVNSFVYLKKVLLESLRLYPPAWIMGRRNTTLYKYKDFEIEPNTVFLISQYLMHRDPRFFKDPNKFIPERWTEEMKINLPKFAFVPFGGGNRICIGEHFAWMEVTLILVTILQKWSLRLAKEQVVAVDTSFTLRPKYGMNMILKEKL